MNPTNKIDNLMRAIIYGQKLNYVSEMSKSSTVQGLSQFHVTLLSLPSGCLTGDGKNSKQILSHVVSFIG